MTVRIMPKCVACKGDKWERCPTCSGIGHVPPIILKVMQQYDMKDKDCPTCGGEKWIPCTKCFGTGKPFKPN